MGLCLFLPARQIVSGSINMCLVAFGSKGATRCPKSSKKPYFATSQIAEQHGSFGQNFCDESGMIIIVFEVEF